MGIRAAPCTYCSVRTVKHVEACMGLVSIKVACDWFKLFTGHVHV
jgi:hypothetical protein